MDENLPREFRSDRTAVRRLRDRGRYDQQTVFSILDSSFICHIGFVEEGIPYVLPTAYVRLNSTLLIHGSPDNRTLQYVCSGAPVCVCVTILDGLVLAKSAMHHSLNYRSVMIIGSGNEIKDEMQKATALRHISEHLLKGRWEDVRSPTGEELLRTKVASIKIDEASAKIRTGPAKDAPADSLLPTWTGVLPVSLQAGAPIPDSLLTPSPAVPLYIQQWLKGIES
jgi:uncharacterized protein